MGHHPINLFSQTINTLSRSLDLRSRQHGLILNNVANADTPNYKPFSINVEEALQTEHQAGGESRLMRTDRQHLPGQPGSDAPQAVRHSNGDDPLLFRGDRNAVDIDAEMAALAKNSLLYKASAQIVAAKFRGLKNVITGGNK